ncbi:MAG: hypothetical protein P8X85_18785, partial [Desulfobacterales bacterium]
MDFSYRVYLLALPEGYLAGIWLSPNQIQYPNFALRIEIHNFADCGLLPLITTFLSNSKNSIQARILQFGHQQNIKDF